MFNTTDAAIDKTQEFDTFTLELDTFLSDFIEQDLTPYYESDEPKDSHESGAPSIAFYQSV